MTTDFSYGGKQIVSGGPLKPNGKDMPSDARTRVDCYADIATIPNPYVGLKITVKVDETNNNKMTDYIVKSLKANSIGVANSLIDEVVRYVDYLGVNTSGSSGEGLTSEQAQQLQTAYLHSQSTHVQASDIPSLEGYATETFVTNKIAEASLSGSGVDLSGYATKDELNAKANATHTHTVSDITNLSISTYQTKTDDELITQNKTIVGAINETFQSVSNGKTLIASAITDKGVTTSNNDTFQVMADNISKINSVITDVNINSYNILKDNWKFKLLSNNGTDRSYTDEISQSYDDSTFENISIPHDWAIYKEFNSSSPGKYEGGYLDGGDGVYRIKLDTTSLNGQKVFLYFDGIFMESEVYINGNLIGLNKWYNPFYFDITNSLNFDGNDTLAVLVRVKQPCSRWYSGAGIFRNVYLVTGNYIDVAINSIHVTTPNLETELTKGYATTNVKMSINNKNEESKNINIKNEIYFNNELVAYNNEVK